MRRTQTSKPIRRKLTRTGAKEGSSLILEISLRLVDQIVPTAKVKLVVQPNTMLRYRGLPFTWWVMRKTTIYTTTRLYLGSQWAAVGNLLMVRDTWCGTVDFKHRLEA